MKENWRTFFGFGTEPFGSDIALKNILETDDLLGLRDRFDYAVRNSGRWIVESKAANIPYLKAENANGRHILIQPIPLADPYYIYMMADDLDPALLRRHHRHPDGSWKPGRMVVETSPGQFLSS